VPTAAIVDIGGSVLVNSAYLSPPYQVAAIGPADLYETLAASAGFVDLVRTRVDAYGIRISFAEPETVTVPAYAGSVTLRYARPPATSPTPVSHDAPAVSRSRSPVTFLLGFRRRPAAGPAGRPVSRRSRPRTLTPT
jgi:hypothetical protein